MPLTNPPTAPTISDPSTFAARADALAQWFATHVTEVNALNAAMNSLAAGTAIALPYTFDSTTTDSDPGAGKVRLSAATPAASTVIRMDLSTSASQDVTAILDMFDASTSTGKGQIKLIKATDPTAWAVFSLTARAAPTGYRNMTVTFIAASSSTPFTNGDALIAMFTSIGDKGDTGPTYSFPTLHVRDEKTSGSAPANSSSGANTRVLNTVKTNTIPSASLGSNQITLPAGTYKVYGKTPLYGTGGVISKAYLYNTTDSSVALVGSSSSDSSNGSCDSYVIGVMTIASTKVFELRQNVSSSSIALGVTASVSSIAEVYAELFVEKVA